MEPSASGVAVEEVTQHKSPAFRRGFFLEQRILERLGNEAGKYYHAINHAFLADDRDPMADSIARPELSGRVC